MKAILQYMEEGWLGKSQNRMQGVIFKYDPNNDDKTRIKDVADSDIVARLDGCWHEQIHWSKGSRSFDKSVSHGHAVTQHWRHTRGLSMSGNTG